MASYGLPVDAKTTAKVIKDLCNLTGWHNEPSFPGSQVVTLTRASLGKLSKHDYYVAEKSDGTRLMMLIEEGKGYLIDRKCKVVLTNSCFPLQMNAGAQEAQHFHNGTVLDGEMLEEKDGDRMWLSYLVYDVVAVGGVLRGGEKLYTRLQVVATNYIIPPVRVHLASGMQRQCTSGTKYWCGAMGKDSHSTAACPDRSDRASVEVPKQASGAKGGRASACAQHDASA
jgi:hypothetical protein